MSSQQIVILAGTGNVSFEIGCEVKMTHCRKSFTDWAGSSELTLMLAILGIRLASTPAQMPDALQLAYCTCLSTSALSPKKEADEGRSPVAQELVILTTFQNRAQTYALYHMCRMLECDLWVSDQIEKVMDMRRKTIRLEEVDLC